MFKLSQNQKTRIAGVVSRLLRHEPCINHYEVHAEVHTLKTEQIVSIEMLTDNEKNLHDRMVFELGKQLLKKGLINISIEDDFSKRPLGAIDWKKVTMTVKVIHP